MQWTKFVNYAYLHVNFAIQRQDASHVWQDLSCSLICVFSLASVGTITKRMFANFANLLVRLAHQIRPVFLALPIITLTKMRINASINAHRQPTPLKHLIETCNVFPAQLLVFNAMIPFHAAHANRIPYSLTCKEPLVRLLALMDITQFLILWLVNGVGGAVFHVIVQGFAPNALIVTYMEEFVKPNAP